MQAGGSLILSTHFKDGMTTDSTGQPVFWWFNIFLRKESQREEEFRIFTVNKSVTADGSLLSPTGCVKGMNISCTWYSRTFYNTQMATEQCVHLHAQLRTTEHDSRRLDVLSYMRSYVTCGSSLTCVSFQVIHACALVFGCLSVLPSPVSLLLLQVLLPPLPDVYPGAWRELHGWSPVQLQLREHGQPGLCHTRHSCSISEWEKRTHYLSGWSNTIFVFCSWWVNIRCITFSKFSLSEKKLFLFQIPSAIPAIKSHSGKIPRGCLLPNCRILTGSLGENVQSLSRKKVLLVFWMILQIVFHAVFSNFSKGVGHFTNNSIP